MNFKRKLQILFLTFLILPLNVFAYPKYLVPGGENLGIHIQNNGILVVGFYDNQEKKSDLAIGDIIVSINDQDTKSINDMLKIVDVKDDEMNLKIGYLRNQILSYTNMFLKKDINGVFKTGLYVKDSITGIGTLTYIDPNSNMFGALGHSVADSKTNVKFDVKDGKIFRADITSIERSKDGTTGEKNAKFYFDTSYGTIEKNMETGIYGIYKKEYEKDNILEVSTPDKIKIGEAYIRTTLDNNEVENFNIEILNVDLDSKTKNILFAITDDKLLKKTGGIIKGMSGSPIIQDNKIIGAVTHTVISDNTKGYGISIINMLESME